MSEPPQKHGERCKEAETRKRNQAVHGFSPQESHTGGQFRPLGSKQLKSPTTSVRVRLPAGLRRDIEEMVEYLGLWPNVTEFIREAIRRERDRRIDEVRAAGARLEDDQHKEGT